MQYLHLNMKCIKKKNVYVIGFDVNYSPSSKFQVTRLFLFFFCHWYFVLIKFDFSMLIVNLEINVSKNKVLSQISSISLKIIYYVTPERTKSTNTDDAHLSLDKVKNLYICLHQNFNGNQINYFLKLCGIS